MRSFWENGATYETDFSDWTEAELRPEGAPKLELDEAENGLYDVEIDGPGEAFYGTLRWAEAGERLRRSSDEIGGWEPVPQKARLAVPQGFTGEARLVLQGHYRSPAGTGQRVVQEASSSAITPPGTPIIEIDSNSIPADLSEPDTNGILLLGRSRSWMSAGGRWLPISRSLEATGSLVDEIDITADYDTDDESSVSASRTGTASWSASAEFSTIDKMRVTIETESVVRRAEPVARALSGLRLVRTHQSPGAFSFDYDVDPSGNARRQALSYRLVTEDDEEQLISISLTNTDLSYEDGPSIYDVEAFNSAGSDKPITIDRIGGSTWDLTIGEGDWQDAVVLLYVDEVDEIDDVTGPDFADGDLSLQGSKTPPYIYMKLADDAFADSDTETVELTVTDEDGQSLTATLNFITS